MLQHDGISNGQKSANKQNPNMDEPKPATELTLLIQRLAKMFPQAAEATFLQHSRGSLSLSDIKSRIDDWRAQLNNNYAADLSDDQPSDVEQGKRRAEYNLELELLVQQVKELEDETLPTDNEQKILESRTHIYAKRRKALFKIDDKQSKRKMQQFFLKNIFEAVHSRNFEVQDNNCYKIESSINKYLHELLDTGRQKHRDPIFQYIANKHNVNFQKHLEHYQQTFGYTADIFKSIGKYKAKKHVPVLGYNYSKVRNAYGGVNQQPIFQIQKRDTEVEAHNLVVYDSYPTDTPRGIYRLPDDQVIRAEWIKQTKNIFKVARLGQKLKEQRDGILKRLAYCAVKEVFNRYSKCEKTQKDWVSRAKRLHRENQLYWRKRQKQLIQVKKKKEKLQAELRKREQEERQSILQVRRLEYLMQQSDLYAHFMAQKLGIETEPIPAPQGMKKVDVDEEAVKLNLSEMINEQKEHLKKFDGPNAKNQGQTVNKIDLSSVDQGSFNQLIETPSSFRGSLKSYQLKGLRWLDNLYEQGINGILADEMGLGKTIQAIALLSHISEHKKVWGPFLVIAPSSTLFNWQQEIKKFCPSLRPLPYWGTLKQRKTIRKFFTDKKFTRSPQSPFHVVITSYQLAVSDEKTFQRLNWQYMILDEAQAIKNIGSQRWGILMNFKARNKLLLTGTPIQNTMAELWALLHFIMPKVFDSHQQFQKWFSKDIQAHSQDQKALNQHQIQKLHAILKPFMLRRVKKDVEHEIGKKIEHQIICEMTKRQQHLYDSLKQKLNLKEFFKMMESKLKVENLMNLVMQFRKVCNHPQLFERRPARSAFLFQNMYYYTGYQPTRFGGVKDISMNSRNPITFTIPKRVYDEIMTSETKQQFSKRELNIYSSHNINQSNNQHMTNASEQSQVASFNSCFSFLCLMDLPTSILEQSMKLDYLHTYIILLHWYKNKYVSTLSTKENIILETDHSRHVLKPQEMGFLFTFIPLASAPPIDVDVVSARFTRTHNIMRWNTFHNYILYGQRKLYYEQPYIRGNSRWRGITEQAIFNGVEVIDFNSLIADSTKLKELDRILKEKKDNGDRVLIFCQMTKMLDILEDFMNKKKYSFFRLDGSLNIADRRDMVNEFQSNPKIFAFLLSTRAGGLGVTLTAANTVIFYDNDWNPTMDAQATDRAHRIGQRSDVNVYRLVTKGTVEERIIKRAQQKQTVQSTVYEGTFKADVFKPHEMIELLCDENDMNSEENQRLMSLQKAKENKKRLATFIPGHPGRPRENKEEAKESDRQQN